MKKIILLTVFCLGAMIIASGQEQQAQKLLSEAIYQEEVNGKLDEAIKTYQLILKQYPDSRKVSAKALLRLGMCYEKLGSEQAAYTYRQLIKEYSENKEEVTVAKERLTSMEVFTAELYRQAEEHFKNGNELFKKWEYESAIEEYGNAVKSGPNTQLALNARYCIGQSLYRAGKFDEAIATFAKLIEENPESNIAPVSELMIAQVKNVLENKKSQVTTFEQSDKNTIVDPKTGITYRKIRTFTGGNDVIDIPVQLILSPNGKYLLSGNSIVPMDGSAPFDLIDARSNGFIPTRSIWSPDGTKVAFYSGDALCVIPVSPETGRATGPFKRIFKAKLKSQPLPGWSPDGTKIAFFANSDLWTISSDGNDLKRITENEGLEIGPVWSPDGKTIAYGSADTSIVLYNVENNEFAELVKTGHRSFPAWSPDGKWILDKSLGFHFYSLVDKSDFEFPLVKGIGTFFSWQADSNKLLFFASSYKSDMFLRIAPSNGGPSFEPVPRLSLLDQTWWRSDSKSIAVQGWDENGDIVIKMVPLSGGISNIIKLDKMPGGTIYPWNLSSDFKQVTFSNKMDNGIEELYTVPFSAEEAKITGPPSKFFEKDWKKNMYKFFSADGKKLALIHEGIIWILFTNGDDPIRVTDLKERVDYLRWTTDGMSLLFSTSSGWKLMENPGQKGKITELTDEGKKIECGHFNIDISPDNTKLAVLTNQQIKIIPVDGTKSSKILDISKLELKQCFELYWSPDGKSLAFIGDKEMEDKVSFPFGKSLIYNVHVDSGIPLMVATDDVDSKLFLSWSPDSKWIAYVAYNTLKVHPESAIWEADFNEIVKKLSKK